MSEIPAGAMRFNSDSQKLEYYDGAQWLQVSTFSPLLNGGARGVFSGGFLNPGDSNEIDYINIASTGQAIDFGANLINARRTHATFSSRTRGVMAAGYGGGGRSDIEYLTIASTGTVTSFGSLDLGLKWNCAGASNETRGLIMGGETPSPATFVDEVEYVTIASTGNAKDFGNLSESCRTGGQGGAANPTRAVVHRGNTPSGQVTGIDFITIATLGDGQDYADLSAAKIRAGTLSNPIRALFGGGINPTNTDLIESLSIASGGGATSFGDLTVAGRRGGTASSPTRGVWGGNISAPSDSISNEIDYVTIQTEGNAVDFGDLSVTRGQCSGFSNAHGGL